MMEWSHCVPHCDPSIAAVLQREARRCLIVSPYVDLGDHPKPARDDLLEALDELGLDQLQLDLAGESSNHNFIPSSDYSKMPVVKGGTLVFSSVADFRACLKNGTIQLAFEVSTNQKGGGNFPFVQVRVIHSGQEKSIGFDLPDGTWTNLVKTWKSVEFVPAADDDGSSPFLDDLSGLIEELADECRRVILASKDKNIVALLNKANRRKTLDKLKARFLTNDNLKMIFQEFSGTTFTSEAYFQPNSVPYFVISYVGLFYAAESKNTNTSKMLDDMLNFNFKIWSDGHSPTVPLKVAKGKRKPEAELRPASKKGRGKKVIEPEPTQTESEDSAEEEASAEGD